MITPENLSTLLEIKRSQCQCAALTRSFHLSPVGQPRTTLNLSKLAAYELFMTDGHSIEEVAGLRRIRPSTVQIYVLDSIHGGHPYCLRRCGVTVAKFEQVLFSTMLLFLCQQDSLDEEIHVGVVASSWRLIQELIPHLLPCFRELDETCLVGVETVEEAHVHDECGSPPRKHNSNQNVVESDSLEIDSPSNTICNLWEIQVVLHHIKSIHGERWPAEMCRSSLLSSAKEELACNLLAKENEKEDIRFSCYIRFSCLNDLLFRFF
jgi:hypothetical protein